MGPIWSRNHCEEDENEAKDDDDEVDDEALT